MPEELKRDLEVIDRSLRQFNDDIIADDRLARLRSAVTTFGFHLLKLGMRQSSESFENVLTEIFAAATINPEYSALGGAARAVPHVAFLPLCLRHHGAGHG